MPTTLYTDPVNHTPSSGAAQYRGWDHSGISAAPGLLRQGDGENLSFDDIIQFQIRLRGEDTLSPTDGRTRTVSAIFLIVPA